MTYRCLSSLLALSLSACAAGSTAPADQRASAPPAPAALPLGVVAEQTLEDGQCLLVLWSRTPEPVRLLAALDRPAVARVQYRDVPLELPRMVSQGEPRFGHAPEQEFARGTIRIALRLDFEQRDRMIAGLVVPRGTLTLSHPPADDMVLPVAGMVACQ